MRRVAAVVVGEGWRGGEQKTDASFWNICSRTNSGLSPPPSVVSGSSHGAAFSEANIIKHRLVFSLQVLMQFLLQIQNSINTFRQILLTLSKLAKENRTSFASPFALSPSRQLWSKQTRMFSPSLEATCVNTQQRGQP